MKERLLLKRQIYTTLETAPEKTMGAVFTHGINAWSASELMRKL